MKKYTKQQREEITSYMMTAIENGLEDMDIVYSSDDRGADYVYDAAVLLAQAYEQGFLEDM